MDKKYNKRTVLSYIVLFFLIFSNSIFAENQQWFRLHGDNASTGYTAFSVSEKAPSSLLWKYNGNYTIETAPVLMSGMLYYATVGYQSLVRVDAKTGKFMNSLSRYPVKSGPVVKNNMVYAGFEERKSPGFAAFVPDSETPKWTYSKFNGGEFQPAVTHDTVYVCNTRTLLALDARSGSEKWSTSPEYGCSDPAVVDGIVYTRSYKHITAIDANTGKIKWVFDKTEKNNTEVSVTNGLVLFGSDDKHVYALDAGTGEIKWKTSLPRPVILSLAVDKQHVYAIAGKSLFSLKLKNGKVRWEEELGFAPRKQYRPVIANKILLMTDYKRLSAYDTATGNKIWSINPGQIARIDYRGLTNPVVGNGAIYIGAGTYVLALK